MKLYDTQLVSVNIKGGNFIVMVLEPLCWYFPVVRFGGVKNSGLLQGFYWFSELDIGAASIDARINYLGIFHLSFGSKCI